MARRTTIANRWFLKSFSAVVIVLVLLDIVLYCVFRSYFYSTVEQTLRSELNVISTVLHGTTTAVQREAEQIIQTK